MLPRRPIQHQREDESRRAFEALLPSRLVFRSEYGDYGIDGELEEFDEADEATGRRFKVQLKATDARGAAAMRERIKLSTAAYYRAQQLPVLMVRYLAVAKRLYGRWFHEFDPYYEHVGDTHLTFHWSEGHELSTASFDALFADVERIIRLKTAGVHLPLSLAVETPSGGVHGCARAEIELAFDGAISRCPGVFERVQVPPADVTCGIDEDELRASVAGLASVTFHLGEGVYPADTSPEMIVCDALSCTAAALARAGRGEPAARIAAQFYADSFLSAIPPAGGELAAAMVESGRVVEAIELADRLDGDEEEARQAAGVVLMQAVRERSESLQPHEQTSFEAALRDRLRRRLDAGRNEDASGAAENLGRYLMIAARPWDAIEFIEQAVTLDPTRETADLAQLRAGAYFLGGRYADSVAAYDRALELAGETDLRLQARRADALFYAGRYRTALEAFSTIETDDPALGAWIYVKARALEWVIEATGIQRQDAPDPEAANELAGRWSQLDSDEDSDALAAEVWELDAASPLGWFNRARDLLDRGLDDDAMHAYLTAAVMREGDVEAWVNVAILADNTGDRDLFTASAITGNRLNKGHYMTEFVRQLRATIPDIAVREEMLSLVRRATDGADQA